MAAITEHTRFDYYNALEQQAYPVTKIFKMANRPGTIFISLKGVNPGWKVGQLISFKNAQTAFSGKIWYIYRGSGHYNLYVKHPNPGGVTAMPGGQVIAGSFPTTNEYSSEPSPATNMVPGPFDPPQPGPVIAPQQASMLPSFLTQRNLLIGAGILVAFIVIRNV